MNHAQLQAEVRKLCKKYELYHFHPQNSIGSERGWPDSSIIGPQIHRIAFWELKTEPDSCTPQQLQVGKWLRECGLSWEVMRPSDLRSGLIEMRLAVLAGQHIPEKYSHSKRA